MKNIFILSILLTLSFGHAYGGDIIRITNGPFYDTHPIINSQGHVWWIQWEDNKFDPITTPQNIMYYDGQNNFEIAHHINDSTYPAVDLTYYGDRRQTDGNYFVYYRRDKTSINDTEIYLFDGQNEIQITNNDYDDLYPVISNGYLAWSGYVNDGGTWDIFLYKPEQPTAAQFTTLKATPSNKQIKIEWQSESEIDNAGFNVWRAEGFQKVNESMIPAEGSPIMGADYDFFDKWVMNGKLYYYLVEDIDNNGISTFHGPVKATPRWICGAGK